MKKKQLISSFLATAMFVNVFATTAYAYKGVEVFSSNTQTSSAEETIYVDSYSETAREINFNDNWKFNLGDTGAGSSALDFNDSSWRTVDLPHDYSIEQDYSADNEAESGYLPGGTGWYRKTFTIPKEWKDKKVQIDFGGVYMNATVYLNGEELGFHPYGYTAFSFELPQDLLKYDGENVISVKVDHKTPTSRWYSGSGIYRTVNLTVTQPVHIAQYGTYITTPKLKDSSGANGETVIKTTLQNDTDTDANVTVKHTIYEGLSKNYKESTKSVGTVTSENITISPKTKVDNTSTINFNAPKLWSPESPDMYFVRTEVTKDGKVIDTYDTDFGYRYIEFGNEFGFKLNGKNTKFKGVCMHHDQGALGSEAWYRAMERQVEILKDMGCNTIRVTHNPAAKEFIEICNEKGMMVVDEAFDMWVMPKNGNVNDYSAWFEKTIDDNNNIVGAESGMTWAEYDLKAMVHQDKNSPAVVMYSLGNEIFEGTANDRDSEYPGIADQLCQWLQEIDATRPPTFGQNSRSENVGKEVGKVLNKYGGISGVNYAGVGRYDTWNGLGLLVYNSETASAVNSRGVYDRKDNNGDGGRGDRLLTSYDKSAVAWGATASDAWMRTIQRDASMGEFVWTGFDYIGEPTPWNGSAPGASGGKWPAPKSSYFGIIDTNGLPKDSYYLYQSMWNDDVNTLHILPTWNKEDIMIDEHGEVEVVVYSDAAKIKLFLNDEEIAEATSKEYTTEAGYKHRIWQGQEGDKDRYNHKKLYATFNIPYKEGELKAVAYDEQDRVISKTQGRNIVKTTGTPTKLQIDADRDVIDADGDDLSYITVDVTDSEGNIVNSANNEITFSVEGDGKLVGVDNGRQIDHTSYQSPTHKAGAGQVVAIVQSTKEDGEFTVTAKSSGLTQASTTIKTEPVEEDDAGSENPIVSYDIARYHYVKLGNKPELPSEVEVTYKDGKTETKKVNWVDYDNELINKEGSFAISGKIEGTEIPVGANITMIGEVHSLLNYSAAVQKNQRSVNLPATRPVVLPNGTILNAEFPVDWDMNDVNLDEVGTHTINGTSSVFGKQIPVKATIRVAEGTVNVGPNVGLGAEVSQSIPEDSQSGKLEAIKDGKTEYGENAYWSNEKAQSNSASIEFEYATVNELKQISVYYITEEGKFEAPKNVSFKWSPTGSDNLTPLEVQTSEPVEVSTNGNKKVYRVDYDFDPISALVVQLELENADNSHIALTEVELKLAEYSFPISSEDTLSKITVNGVEATEEALKNREYIVEALIAEEVKVESDKNTAFNILPEKDNVIKILTESEDHSKRGEYRIILGGEIGAGDPADGSRDYDRTKTKATAPSYAGVSGNEGGPDFAVDGKDNTFYHSRWGSGGNGPTDLRDKPEQRYIQLTLDEVVEADAIRYLPRSGDNNGRIQDYLVSVSLDGVDWKTVSKGSGWSDDAKWKMAVFDEPTKVKYVRLFGTNTYSKESGGKNKYLSAAEIRVRKAPEKIDISNAKVTLGENLFDYTGYEIKPRPAKVELNGKELKYGVDYLVEYQNNIQPGTATLTVRGIMNYSGTTPATAFIINPVELNVKKYEPVKVKTKKGIEPVLPNKVKAQVDIGPDIEFDVKWEEIDPEKYSKPGTFEVKGAVEGQKLQPVAKITVIGVVEENQNINTATVEKTIPVLPEKLDIYLQDGTSINCPVVWDKINEEDLVAGTTIKVWGTAIINMNEAQTLELTNDENIELKPETKRVSATIRVASDKDIISNDNMALNKENKGMPTAVASHGPANDKPSYMNDGKYTESVGNGKQLWTNWNYGAPQTDETIWAGIILDESQISFVNEMEVSFIGEEATGENTVRLPKDFKIQYYTGDIYDYNTNSPSNGAKWEHLGNDENWEDVTNLQKTPIDIKEEANNLLLKSTLKNVTLLGNDLLSENKGDIPTILPVFPDKEEGDKPVTLPSFPDEEEGDKPVTLPSFPDEEEDRPVTLPSFPDREDSKEYLNKQINDENRQRFKVTFDEVKAKAFRVVITPQEKRYVGIDEIKMVGKYFKPNSDFEVTSIKLGGEDITEKFDENKELVYSLKEDAKIPKLEATVKDGSNASVTIVQSQLQDGQSVVHITSEDGSKEEIYKVKFQIEEPEEVMYTVTFNTNGGSNIDPVQIRDGEILNAPIPPTRSGYTFNGWFEDKECKVEYKFDKPVTKDMTLYADWKKNDGGSNGGGSSSGGSSSGSSSKPAKPVKPEQKPEVVKPGENVVLGDGSKAVVVDKDGKEVIIDAKQTDKGLQISLEKDGKSIDSISEAVDIAIPVNAVGMGNVAIIVDKNGNETIVKGSYLKDGNMLLSVDKSCTIKVENRAMTFIDVNNSSWFKDSVDFVTARGLFAGTTQTDFAPNQNMNRGMLATVLYRLAGEPTVNGNMPFGDVSSNSYYSSAIVWAAQNGFVSGISENEFAPESSITREQLAAILYRYAGSPSVDKQNNKFTDENEISSWANDAIYWAVENGIISGRTDGSLDPQGNATRAEVSSMFMRMIIEK